MVVSIGEYMIELDNMEEQQKAYNEIIRIIKMFWYKPNPNISQLSWVDPNGNQLLIMPFQRKGWETSREHRKGGTRITPIIRFDKYIDIVFDPIDPTFTPTECESSKNISINKDNLSRLEAILKEIAEHKFDPKNPMLFSLKDTKEFLGSKNLEKYFEDNGARFEKTALGFNLTPKFLDKNFRGVEPTRFEFPFNGQAIHLTLDSMKAPF